MYDAQEDFLETGLDVSELADAQSLADGTRQEVDQLVLIAVEVEGQLALGGLHFVHMRLGEQEALGRRDIPLQGTQGNCYWLFRCL